MTSWLLTWLWQGLALVMATGAGLRLARRLNAATRHAVWSAALVVLAGLGWVSSPYRGGGAPAIAAVAPEPLFPVPAAPDPALAIVLDVWAAVALVGLARVVPGLRAVYALRDRCRAFPGEIEARLPLWLEARERGRRASLRVCDAAPGAIVLGFHRPWIAVPSSLLQALSADELDQVILHEHAHVQRRDDWVRLGESLLLAVLWIHPAAMLIARALGREREMACDDWVVARTGLPKVYARCLAHAAEVRGRVRTTPVMASALFGQTGDLGRRVERLLAVRGRTRRHVAPATAALAVGGLMSGSATMNAVHMFGEAVAAVLPQIPAAAGTRAAERGGEANLPALLEMSDRLPVSAGGGSQKRLNPPVPAVAAAPTPRVSPVFVNGATAVLPASDGSIDAGGLAMLPSLAFSGRYGSPSAPARESGRPSVWGAAAMPGVSAAAAARKTGLGVAGALTRAAVSLTRAF